MQESSQVNQRPICLDIMATKFGQKNPNPWPKNVLWLPNIEILTGMVDTVVNATYKHDAVGCISLNLVTQAYQPHLFVLGRKYINMVVEA